MLPGVGSDDLGDDTVSLRPPLRVRSAWISDLHLGTPGCQARRLLDSAGLRHTYLEYGSYLSDWRRRNALKMWTGWPTLPMVFVKGTLIGGATDLERLIANGELNALAGTDR